MEINLLWLLLGGVVGLAIAIYFMTRSSSDDSSLSSKRSPVVRFPTKGKGEVVQIDEDDGRPVMKIFWGSQTGTAEDFSETLGDEADANGFRAVVIDMEDYDPENLVSESLVVLVAATYGEGEPTDNAKEFYDWVMEDNEDDILKGVKYTVFGLGNTTYEHYNKIGKDFDQRMEILGAERIFPRGEGDDDSTLEEDWMKWKEALWPEIKKTFGVEGDGLAGSKLRTRHTKLVYTAKDPKEYVIGTLEKRDTYDHKVPYLAKIVVNKELHTEKSDRSCRHIEIEFGDNLRYSAGDHLGVFPLNNSHVIEATAKRLGILDRLEEVFELVSVKKGSEGHTVMGPCTFRQALGRLVDLNSVPTRKKFLSDISEYATDPKEKERLEILSSTDESSLPEEQRYNTWVRDARRGVLDILNDFPSVELPIDFFLEVAPALAQRYYSISSSPKECPSRVSITSVVVEYETPTGRHHSGVCSNWFLELEPEENPLIPVYIRDSSFRMPTNHSTPIVMVGPGTGLAPFRGFIQERKHQWRTVPRLRDEIGESLLFFGCRTREQDFLYEKELLAATTEGYLTQIELAFSREGEKKVYVQHLMKDLEDKLYEMIISKGGHFYICGDAAQMAPAVRKELRDIIMSKEGKTEEEAEEVITKMSRNNQFQTDVWF